MMSHGTAQLSIAWEIPVIVLPRPVRPRPGLVLRYARQVMSVVVTPVLLLAVLRHAPPVKHAWGVLRAVNVPPLVSNAAPQVIRVTGVIIRVLLLPVVATVQLSIRALPRGVVRLILLRMHKPAQCKLPLRRNGGLGYAPTMNVALRLELVALFKSIFHAVITAVLVVAPRFQG